MLDFMCKHAIFFLAVVMSVYLLVAAEGADRAGDVIDAAKLEVMSQMWLMFGVLADKS